MTTETESKKRFSLRPGWLRARDPLLFKPSDVEIVVNKKTVEAWIFHVPPLPIEIDYLEYDHKSKIITFVSKQAKAYELGVKVRSLVRPVIEKVEMVTVAQMYEGMPQSWFTVPLRHKNA